MKKLLNKCYHKVGHWFICLTTAISPELNTRLLYRMSFHKKLDLDNPKTLNEKLLWLKLNKYMNDPLVIQCADKLRVREYIKECGCEEILNDLYGVYDRADDIDWEELPEQFVLKWNFGAGFNIICDNKEKLDECEVKKKLNRWGKIKYWLTHSEMQYKYIPKKIICEKYLKSNIGKQPEDYKVYCFNGEAKYVMLCEGREFGHPKFYFFDRDLKLARINRDSKNAPEDFSIPKCDDISEVFDYAEKLSKPFPFVRADFYVIDGKVKFGELTFTPAGGLDSARLPETDIMFGEMLDLTDVK